MLENEPWWITKEICDILGYANPSQPVPGHCKRLKLLKSSEIPLLKISPLMCKIFDERNLIPARF
jgi:prophage antirepressor-like protein